jgi:hypothetical protein
MIGLVKASSFLVSYLARLKGVESFSSRGFISSLVERNSISGKEILWGIG